MKKLLVLFFTLVFLSSIWLINKTEGDYLGEIGVGSADSLDLIYWGLNCFGNVATPESVWVWIYRDATGGVTANVDSVTKAVGELPSRLLRTGQAWLRHYSVRVKSSSGTAGKHHAIIVTDCDTCWTPFRYSWDAVDTIQQTFHSLNYLKTKNIHETIEPYRNRKNLYCLPDSSAVVGGNATTWATACSLKSIVDKLTGAYEYYVYIAPGNYTGVNLSFSTEKMVTFIGAGIHRSIVTGVDQSSLEYPVFCCDNSYGGDVIIQDMTIRAYGMQYAGVGIKDGAISGFEIRRCRIEGFDKGINIDSGSKKTIIENCFISRCAGSAVYVNNEDATIRYNVIDSLTSSASYGISLNATCIGSHIYGNIIYTSAGKGIVATNDAVAKNIIANNYVYAADGSYPEAYSNDNVYVGNHSRSERFAVDTTSTIQEDIYNAPRSANSDSGWTATKAGYLDIAISSRFTQEGGDSLKQTVGYDDDSTLIQFLRYIRNNQEDYKATGFATHSAADAADAVWDEARADHVTGNTFGGDALDNNVWTDAKAGYLNMALSGIPGATWQLDISGYNAANAGTYLRTLRDHMPNPVVGSTWKFLADTIWTNTKAGYLDVAISTRSTHSASDVWAVGTRALTDKVNFALTTDEHKAIADSVWLADTTEYAGIDTTYGGLVTQFGLYKGSGTGATAQEVWEYDISTIYTTSRAGDYVRDIDSVGKAVKTKTDNLPDDPADQSLLMAEVGNIDGWNPITDEDSLVVDQSTMRWDLGGSGSDTLAIKGMMDGNYKNWWATLEPEVNRKNIFVSTSGNPDSSGLSWNGAVDSLEIAERKCTGADEYFVYVAPGTYDSTSCTTSVTNVHWIGAGRGRTFLTGNYGKPVMRIDANGVEIAGFELAGGNDAIWINNSSHFNIHDNRMKNNTTDMGDGILAFGSSHYGRIHDNFFHSQWIFCISIQGDYNLVYNNTIDSLRTVSGTQGIIVSATAKWNTIHHNRIHVEGESYGIAVADGSGDNFIVDNYVYSGTPGQEYKELYSNVTAYVANHGRSGRWEEDTTSTVEEDIHFSVDSVNNAITDPNKANFKADISGLSTFDPSTDSVKTSNPPAYKADVSGLSTFDETTDSVMTANPPAYKADISGLSTFNASSDSVMTSNPPAYKADVSGLSTFDPSIDTVAYVDSLIEPLTLTSVDSVRKVYIVDSLEQTVTASVDSESVARSTWNNNIIPQASRTVNVSGLSTFDPTSDSVMTGNPPAYKADVSNLDATISSTKDFDNYSGTIGASQLEDSAFALSKFKTDYWTGNIGLNWGDITNKTTANDLAGTQILSADQVHLLDVNAVTASSFTAGAITNTAIAEGAIGASELATDAVGEIADGILGENDTTVIDTSKIGEWLIANISGGGASNWSDAQRDSILIAIKDDNKANFKADISGLSTFDPVSDSVMTANPPAYQSSGDTNTFDIVSQLANRPAIGDTNTNPFQAGIDDVILASNLENIAHENYDTMYVHRGDFQGSAAGLTAEEIADTLSNRGYFSGIGALACTVYTKLSTDSSVIPNIHVIVKNTDETSVLAHGYTNANGWVNFGLDSIAGGAYHKFWLINPEYSFTFPESADVNTNGAMTFYGSAFDYGDPPAANQCAVYDQVFNLELDSLDNVVVIAEVRLPADSILRYDGRIISPFAVSDTTNITGRWRIDLIPNIDFLPENTWYVFKFKYPNTWGGWIIREDSVQVPDSTAVLYKVLKGW